MSEPELWPSAALAARVADALGAASGDASDVDPATTLELLVSVTSAPSTWPSQDSWNAAVGACRRGFALLRQWRRTNAPREGAHPTAAAMLDACMGVGVVRPPASLMEAVASAAALDALVPSVGVPGTAAASVGALGCMPPEVVARAVACTYASRALTAVVPPFLQPGLWQRRVADSCVCDTVCVCSCVCFVPLCCALVLCVVPVRHAWHLCGTWCLCASLRFA